MFFTECARLAERQPDLATVFERLDSQFRDMGTAETIRPDDVASFLNLDPNQIRSALDLLVREGVLDRVQMIECSYCEMAAFWSDYQEVLEEDGEYRCTSCDRQLSDETIQIITAYRSGERWQEGRTELPASRAPALSAIRGNVLEPATAGAQGPMTLRVSRSIGSDAAVQALLALKDRKGWTMEELARYLGTTARTLQSLKKQGVVRSAVFRTMAERLGISPEDLLAGNVPGSK
jgi:DNA-binding Xre family transcriptional regulator